VVIDGEAGIEQINRRVMEKVTHLILVTDPSRKGTNVIKVIKQVADELTMYSKIGVIVNRYNDSRIDEYLNLGELPILAKIPDDKELALTDVMGKSVLDLDDDSLLIKGVDEALKNLDIKGGISK
jgi:CO dehydrogenase maturation factor